MTSKSRPGSIGSLAIWIAATVVSNVGCGGGPSQPPISVAVTGPQSVQAGATGLVVATVNGAAAGQDGVTWAVTCGENSCGSVSPAATGNGQPTTYMAPPTRPSSDLTVTVTATSTADSKKSASAPIIVPSVAVAVTPGTSSLPSGGTQQFSATVTGDTKNAGVTWSLEKRFACNPLTCSPGQGTSCDSSCGTVSPANTASGSSVTYIAPATPPSFPVRSRNGKVLLIATSTADNIVSATAEITVSPISVSVSPALPNIALSATQQFTATTSNDGANRGVSWTLMQNGTACSPGCGTITPVSTASGAVATYTAPATAIALPLVTINATSVEDTTKSASATATLTNPSGNIACSTGSGGESLLKGQYAFLLYGFDKALPTNFVGGSFTADGTGKITGGEEDIATANSNLGSDVNINPSGSSYAVGPDHRGCLMLTNANGTRSSFRFALGSINGSNNVASRGYIIEFDDTTGSATRAAGSIRLQDATSFTAGAFKGNYTFGMEWILGNGAMAGTFTSDGVSTITSSAFDADFAGTLTSNMTSTAGGSFTCCSANGRGTLELDSGSLGLGTFAIYMINSSDLFLVSDIVDGEAIGIPSGTTFSQSSLSGVSVLRESAQSSSGPIVDIATASADGKGGLTLNDNMNNAGAFATNSTALNYVVAANGRVAVSGGSTPVVLYLYAQNQGFLVGTDPNGTFGILEPQAGGPFSNATFSGAYIFGIESPLATTVTMQSGVLVADGNGNAAGTSDQSGSAGLAQNQSSNFPYSFPANGVGNLGTGTTAILISGNKLVFINNTSTNPTITVVEK